MLGVDLGVHRKIKKGAINRDTFRHDHTVEGFKVLVSIYFTIAGTLWHQTREDLPQIRMY